MENIKNNKESKEIINSENEYSVAENTEIIEIDDKGKLICTSKPDEDYSLVPWVEKNNRGKITCIPQILCEFIRQHCHLLNTSTFLYIYLDGCYRKFSTLEWHSCLKSFFPAQHRTQMDWKNAFIELRTDTPIPDDLLNDNEDLVNFQNCLYNVRTGEILPHTPEYYSTVQIPCNYIPNLTLADCPIFDSYLDKLTEFTGIECKTILLEYMGAVISNINSARFKKLLILVGCGDSGKSQYRNLLISLIGKNNNADIDLKDLNGNFGTGHLIGKRLAGCGDMSKVNLNDVSILKQLTGGDSLQAVVKYKMGQNMQYKGFLLFLSNGLPQFEGDKGNHVYERFIIIPCDNVIPKEERDKELIDKMLKEKEAIVSVAMQYLKSVVNRGYEFSEGSIVQEMRKQYEVENNSLELFVSECCDIGVGRTLCPVFYEQYANWCKENRYIAERKRLVKKVLSEKLGVSLIKSCDWYYGLTIKEV